MKLKRIEKIDELKYLHSYRLYYKSKNNKDKVWELVSRGPKERLERELYHHDSYTDGTMIFASSDDGKLVAVLKEFRISANRHVYTLPAGLIDPNEDVMTAAIREFKEETGLKLHPEFVEKERYTSVGIINEKVNIVYGKYSGIPSKEFQEESEDADIVLVDKEMAIQLLKEEEVTIRTAMLLQQYFQIHPYFNQV